MIAPSKMLYSLYNITSFQSNRISIGINAAVRLDPSTTLGVMGGVECTIRKDNPIPHHFDRSA